MKKKNFNNLKKSNSKNDNLLKFFGAWKDLDVEKLLKDIKNSRKSYKERIINI